MVDPGWIQTRSTYSFTDLRIILKFYFCSDRKNSPRCSRTILLFKRNFWAKRKKNRPPSPHALTLSLCQVLNSSSPKGTFTSNHFIDGSLLNQTRQGNSFSWRKALLGEGQDIYFPRINDNFLNSNWVKSKINFSVTFPNIFFSKKWILSLDVLILISFIFATL